MSSSCAVVSSTTINSLEALVRPLTREDFLSQYWGKCFLHLPEPKEGFAALFPWSQLNLVLEQYRLRPPRMVLFRNGTQVNQQEYLVYHPDESELRVPKLVNLLGEGATLILNRAEELYSPLTDLTNALERIFRTRVVANLYAAWRTDNSFGLHWDQQDTMIVQVAGRKNWKVYRPTTLYPLSKKDEPPREPTENPIFEGTVCTGELLYIPRGWWHLAVPINEPTLHLTITFVNPTGIHLLHWVVEQLKRFPECRMDLPHLANSEEQEAHMLALGTRLTAAWQSDLIERFMSDLDSRAVPRPIVRLPEAATALIGLDTNSRVTLSTPRKPNLVLDSECKTVSFQCDGHKWQFNIATTPALEALTERRSVVVRELIDLAGMRNDGSFVQDMLLKLLKGGVLSIDG